MRSMGTIFMIALLCAQQAIIAEADWTWCFKTLNRRRANGPSFKRRLSLRADESVAIASEIT